MPARDTRPAFRALRGRSAAATRCSQERRPPPPQKLEGLGVAFRGVERGERDVLYGSRSHSQFGKRRAIGSSGGKRGESLALSGRRQRQLGCERRRALGASDGRFGRRRGLRQIWKLRNAGELLPPASDGPLLHVRRAPELLGDEAAFERGAKSALRLDLAEKRPGALGKLAGERFHIARARSRIGHGAKPGFMLQNKVRVAREPSCEGRGASG